MSSRISNRILASVIAAAAIVVLAPRTASAGNPCQSEWVKFKTFFDQNGAKIAKGICQLVNKDGVAGLTPVILLEKPMGLNGHQYQIRGTRGAEPGVVREARELSTARKNAKIGN